MMHGRFLLISEKLFKSLVRLVRRLRVHYLHAIHYSMNMRIDSDIWCVIEVRKNDLSGLHSYSW